MARRDRRLGEITDSTSAISNGPVTFDITHARAWGMSERVINNTWAKIAAIVDRANSDAVRAHPERWRREEGLDCHVFVGEIHDSEAWSRDQKIRAGVTPLDRPPRKRR